MRVGNQYIFELLSARNGYGVFHRRIQADDVGVFIIARIPKVTAREALPASVLGEFYTATSAVLTLNRWIETPAPPKPAPKARKLGACRRNGNRPIERKDPLQTELAL